VAGGVTWPEVALSLGNLLINSLTLALITGQGFKLQRVEEKVVNGPSQGTRGN
jgi:hypothetical protein